MDTGPGSVWARAGGLERGGEAVPWIAMLVIDVYNVLHTTGILPPEIAGPDLDGFIRLLGQSRYRSERLMLVCDGYQPQGRGQGVGQAHGQEENRSQVREHASSGSIQIFFSGHREADDVIEGLVAAAHRTQAPVVVSSDRRVQTAARKRRFGVLASSTFLRHLSQDYKTLSVVSRRPASKPSPRELVPLEPDLVRLWVKALGIEGHQRLGEAAEESVAPIAGKAGIERQEEEVSAGDDAEVAELLRTAKAAAAQRRVARPELEPADQKGPTGRGAKGRAGRGEDGGPKRRSGPPVDAETARSVDRELRALLEDSSDGVEESDLDMTKWLSTHPAPKPESTAEHLKPAGTRRGGRRR